MTRSYLALAALLVGAAAPLAGGGDSPPPPPAEKGPFDDALLKLAATYAEFGRVDDGLRWAPFDCRLPPPARPHVSASKDEDTHGRKLYSLFVKDRPDYPLTLALGQRGDAEADPKWRAKVGQAIVKQAWVPEEVKEAPAKLELRVRRDPREGNQLFQGDHFVPYARKGDKLFKASKQADLFIMLKLDPKTEGTDEGWVYGTVTPARRSPPSARSSPAWAATSRPSATGSSG
jgi:hypothetical protein